MTIDRKDKPVGLTKDVGYEFGLRKTFPINLQDAWQYMTSAAGVRVWLGEMDGFRLEKGATYSTPTGESGVVRVVNPEVNIRLTWQPVGWEKPSTIQVRTISAGLKTTISFHQENLPDENAREQMRSRWEKVMAAIEKDLPG
jgi:uncharacterized protein YndB with AHSA1/START domain